MATQTVSWQRRCQFKRIPIRGVFQFASVGGVNYVKLSSNTYALANPTLTGRRIIHGVKGSYTGKPVVSVGYTYTQTDGTQTCIASNPSRVELEASTFAW